MSVSVLPEMNIKCKNGRTGIPSGATVFFAAHTCPAAEKAILRLLQAAHHRSSGSYVPEEISSCAPLPPSQVSPVTGSLHEAGTSYIQQRLNAPDSNRVPQSPHLPAAPAVLMGDMMQIFSWIDKKAPVQFLHRCLNHSMMTSSGIGRNMILYIPLKGADSALPRGRHYSDQYSSGFLPCCFAGCEQSDYGM